MITPLITRRSAHGLAAAALLVSVLSGMPARAADLRTIELPGERAFPESVTATANGTLYVSSLASGGVVRVAPGASKGEEWIQPGAFDSRSTFGVLADEPAGLLWVCSNDASGLGVPGPGSTPGSHLLAFDLASGEGKMSFALPAKGSVCNDMAKGPDGALYIANTGVPQILRLKPGASELEVWLESTVFGKPEDGPGLDGIAFGSDGNIYVNTYGKGNFFRVAYVDGAAGPVTRLKTPRPLKNPDGLRSIGGMTFVMAEGGGTLDRITVKGDEIAIEELASGLAGPTAVALVGDVLWAPEGQLSHLFDAKSGPPALPFRLVGVTVGP